MSRQIIANGETGANVRDKINDNYRELYQKTGTLEGLIQDRVDTITYDNSLKTFTTTDNYFTADILNNIKLAVMDSNNEVKYYLDNSDVRFKENGEPANIYGYKTDTTVNIGGTDYTVLAADFGTVRVEYPAFYWRYDRNASGNNEYRVSKYFFSGSERFKAFRAYNSVTSEVEDTDQAYVDRYEGVLFDYDKNRPVNGVYIDVTISADSATKEVTFETPVQYLAEGDVLKDTSGVLGAANAVYTVASVTLNASNEATAVVLNEAINDVSGGTNISLRNDVDLANDYVFSVSGYKPVTYISQQDFETLYQNWSGDVSTNLESFWHWQMRLIFSAIQYGNVNIQSALGAGKTGSSADYKYVSVTGLFDSNGITNTVDNTDNDQFAGGALTWGLENTYGNIWKFHTGLFVDDWVIKLTDNNNVFGTMADYENTGIELPHEPGYWGELQNYKAMVPGSIDGSSGNGIGDYFYENSGTRIGLSGGSLADGSAAGVAHWAVYYSASHDSWHLGGRGGSYKS
jgi:hypothetical protein